MSKEGKFSPEFMVGVQLQSAILVAKQMNLPLELICDTIGLPMFKGVAKAVNPNARHSNIQMSENKCIDRIEIT